jgi:hypothetical protein
LLTAYTQLGNLKTLHAGCSTIVPSMDAAEADFDAKLYKASGDIIPELQVKLPLLIWHDQARSKIRTHVLHAKCEQLKQLVCYRESEELVLELIHPSLIAFKNGLSYSIPCCHH